MIDPFVYLWLLLKASLVTTTGTGNIPVLYQDLIPRGWATDRQPRRSLLARSAQDRAACG
jgi:hypothetical protein